MKWLRAGAGLCALAIATAPAACAHGPGPARARAAVPESRTGPREASLGRLFFDPESADYTTWINHFKNQVYRNWALPEAVRRGANGHVAFEFMVERSGSMSGVSLLKSSGSSVLDEAAQMALKRSQFLALPEDYPGASVTMQLTFFYNETPR